ncbi:MAG: L-2-amino-thiazoline-4-carboxylic acid hydrolase [bacterium]|nr:L-2-amino-thiazoline-4-carboxylic acid hydrolase [bacterium]
MKKSLLLQMDRRKFVSKVIPACAVTCLGLDKVFAMDNTESNFNILQEVHKFDKPLPMGITYKQYMQIAVRGSIEMAKAVEEEYGKEKMIEMVRSITDKRMIQRGEAQAKQLPDTSLKSYTAQFKGPQMQAALTFDIVEDTDQAFEINVTECLNADVFKQMKAEDIGHAAVCWGDYSWATAFNPKIKLIRDKTLMQGHACCNHRYVMTD